MIRKLPRMLSAARRSGVSLFTPAALIRITLGPSHATFAPRLSRTLTMRSVSLSLGTFVRTHSSSISRLAAIAPNAAFLGPYRD
jgi:hypothetical protein